MKLFFSALMVASAVVLSGCIPIKHRYLTAPLISGTVTRAGVPVPGVHVQLADVLNDTGVPTSDALKDDAVTDAQGHFTVGPLYRVAKNMKVSVVKVNLKTVPWGLRLSSDSKTWHAGWLSDPTMIGEVPKAPLSAMCDLSVDSKSSVIDGDIQVVGNGPCILQLVEKKKK
ncbi:MAG TPA: carboxypeptidase-like regulatory domain-containing protein [Rhodanobacter sp.]